MMRPCSPPNIAPIVEIYQSHPSGQWQECPKIFATKRGLRFNEETTTNEGDQRMAKAKAAPAASAPILILGATGALGQHLIQQLRQEQRPIRTYIRNLQKADEVELTGATVQIGKMTDQPRLSKAVEGV